MKSIIYCLCMITLSSASTITSTACERQIVKTHVTDPYNLALDVAKNVLYFSYTDKTKSDYFSLARVDLKGNAFEIVEGVNGGFAAVTDNDKTHDAFFGGNDGVYKYDASTNTATHVGTETEHNLWQMIIKSSQIYYTTFTPSEKLYTFKNGASELVAKFKDTAVKLVAIGNDDTMYIANSTGLYRYPKDSVDGTLYKGDYDNVVAFNVDAKGGVYFATTDAIYAIKGADQVEKIAEVDDCHGFAIGSDGSLYYADDDTVYEFTIAGTECRVSV